MSNRESLLERYDNIETRIKGLFTNCTSIWNSYNKKHTGTDFAAPLGTPVMASSGANITNYSSLFNSCSLFYSRSKFRQVCVNS